MSQVVFVCLTIIEVYLRSSDTGALLLVHDLLNKLQLFTGDPGSRVDFGLDFLKCFMGTHEWWQVLGVQ